MHIELRAAIERCVQRFAKSEQVIAALLVLHPSLDAEEFRYAIPGDQGEAWRLIHAASDDIKRAGRARLVNDAIAIGGEPRRLLVSSFDGAGHSPFIIVVARMPDDAFVLADVRRAMQQVAECCISKTGSPRWS